MKKLPMIASMFSFVLAAGALAAPPAGKYVRVKDSAPAICGKRALNAYLSAAGQGEIEFAKTHVVRTESLSVGAKSTVTVAFTGALKDLSGESEKVSGEMRILHSGSRCRLANARDHEVASGSLAKVGTPPTLSKASIIIRSAQRTQTLLDHPPIGVIVREDPQYVPVKREAKKQAEGIFSVIRALTDADRPQDGWKNPGTAY